MKSKRPRPGWGWIIFGLLLIGGGVAANAARNPGGAIGKTGFGEWAQRRGPVPTRPTRTTDNGSQLDMIAILIGALCIAGGATLLAKGNNSGWDL